MFESEKCVLYRVYKEEFGLEKYLSVLPMSLRIPLCKFRTSNHKLPIEKGRYTNILRHQRVCNKCELNKLGDEYHLLLECTWYNNLREKHIPSKFWKRPNTFKFGTLVNTKSKRLLLQLAKFVKEAFLSF